MNFIICYTPLHALIAQRLIEQGHIQDFCLLYITFGINEKHQMYYDRLKSSARYSTLLTLSHRPLSDALNLFKWYLSNFRAISNTKTLLVGNLKHIHTRLLIGLVRPKTICTFDDGCGNVSGSGYFYELNEHKLGNILFGCISPRLLYKNIINEIESHYTIYSESNVYSSFAKEIVKIKLLNSIRNEQSNPSKKITIYLGDALAKDGLITHDLSQEIILFIQKNFSIDYIFPHPRMPLTESDVPNNIKIAKTDLIAEEFIIKWLEMGYQVHVLGIYSTVLLNTQGIIGVEVTNIRIPGILNNKSLDMIFTRHQSQILDYIKKE